MPLGQVASARIVCPMGNGDGNAPLGVTLEDVDNGVLNLDNKLPLRDRRRRCRYRQYVLGIVSRAFGARRRLQWQETKLHGRPLGRARSRHVPHCFPKPGTQGAPQSFTLTDGISEPVRTPDTVEPPPEILQNLLPQPITIPSGRGGMIRRTIALDPQQVPVRIVRVLYTDIDPEMLNPTCGTASKPAARMRSITISSNGLSGKAPVSPPGSMRPVAAYSR
jgi:hypothetical protein